MSLFAQILFPSITGNLDSSEAQTFTQPYYCITSVQTISSTSAKPDPDEQMHPVLNPVQYA
jgi:hypothetical protein